MVKMIPLKRYNVNGGSWLDVAICANRRLCDRIGLRAPVAQLDRAFASEAKGRLFESGRVHHPNHSLSSNYNDRHRIYGRVLFRTVPDFVHTLYHFCPFHRFAGDVQVRVNVAPRCRKVAMTGEICRRVWVENSRPPRHARVPESVRHECSKLGAFAGFPMLPRQGRLLHVPACSRCGEHPRRFAAPPSVGNFVCGRIANLAPRVD